MNYSGLLISFFREQQYSETIQNRAKGNKYFTHGISRRDLKPNAREIAFLSFAPDFLHYVCFATETRSAETGRTQMKFTRFHNLEALGITDAFSPQVADELRLLLSGPAGRFSASGWDRFLAELNRVRPQARNFIEELEQLRKLVISSVPSSALEIMAQEKDATRVALEIFGLDPQEIKDAMVTENNDVAPFLKKLKNVNLLEDHSIHHDSELLPGFTRLGRHLQGATEFVSGSEKITILNVNRTGVEHVLGVDLVYYNHQFDAYLMVQYKRVQVAQKDWCFYCNDSQFLKDVDRIRTFKAMRKSDESETPRSYRFNGECFFFKFCERISYNPLSTDYIPGFYLPFDFLECVMKSHEFREKGQNRLDNNNCARTLNNTQFVYLMRQAWLGSRCGVTETITKIIEASSEQNRSVIVGISQSRE